MHKAHLDAHLVHLMDSIVIVVIHMTNFVGS
jgi:hypothetical protein